MSMTLNDKVALGLAEFQQAFDAADNRRKFEIVAEVLQFVVTTLRNSLDDDEIPDFGVKKSSGIMD